MLCALALLTIGVVMVSSAGMQVQPLPVGADPSTAAATSGVTLTNILTSKPAFFLVAAVVMMFAASLLPVRAIAERFESRIHLPPAGDLGMLLVGTLFLAGLLLLVYVPGIARPMNGAHRWIDLKIPGLESLQPSEVAKWAMIPLIAAYAARLSRITKTDGSTNLHRFLIGLCPALFATGLIAAIIVLEDLGTGFLITCVAGIVLLAAGARLRHFVPFASLAAVGVYFAIATSTYRTNRILAFLDPYADPQDTGFHMIQSMTAFAGAGPFGRGLGHGLQKFGYLPEDTTDFLFAIIGEELGLAGATLVITLYLILIWSATSIARRTTSPLLKLITVGVTATIALQACINIVVVTGLGPTKGIALPLLSAGGTGWIMTAAMLGLVAAIDRAHPVAEPESPLQDRAEPTRPLPGSMIEAKPDRAAKPRVRLKSPLPAAHSTTEQEHAA